MRSGSIWAGIVALSALACDPAAAPPEEISQPIYGGQVATVCQWPTTVLLPAAGCSGTLVHPSIIITAAHCGTKIPSAILGETEKQPARTLAIEYCKTFQGENGPNRTDYAFCKLKTPVTDVPIVPILMGCETQVLQKGQKVIVAGFGDSAVNTGYGTKRWVETTINQVSPTRAIQVGGMGKAPCFGDSGGPAYVKLADGSWRVFGIDSAGLQESCAAGDVMAMMHDAVGWIEQQSGIDITPCHDADGTWHPGPACQGFSVAPDSAGRSWSNGCAEPMLSPPVTTCAADGKLDGGAEVDAHPDVRPASPDVAAALDARPEFRHDAGAGHVADAAPAAKVDARPSEPSESEPDPTPPAKMTAHAKGCGCALGGRTDDARALALAIGLLALARRRRR